MRSDRQRGGQHRERSNSMGDCSALLRHPRRPSAGKLCELCLPAVSVPCHHCVATRRPRCRTCKGDCTGRMGSRFARPFLRSGVDGHAHKPSASTLCKKLCLPAVSVRCHDWVATRPAPCRACEGRTVKLLARVAAALAVADCSAAGKNAA